MTQWSAVKLLLRLWCKHTFHKQSSYYFLFITVHVFLWSVEGDRLVTNQKSYIFTINRTPSAQAICDWFMKRSDRHHTTCSNTHHTHRHQVDIINILPILHHKQWNKTSTALEIYSVYNLTWVPLSMTVGRREASRMANSSLERSCHRRINWLMILVAQLRAADALSCARVFSSLASAKARI